MGLVDHLWDDTIAGPRPDMGGFGKLRRYDSVPVPKSDDISTPISRKIMIVKPKNYRNLSIPDSESSASSVPSSPAGASTPGSPFSPRTPRLDMKRLSRRKSMPEAEAFERAEPRSPTVYDWVVISALDR